MIAAKSTASSITIPITPLAIALAISPISSARINLQYYADRTVDSEAIEETKKHSKLFFYKNKRRSFKNY